MGGVITSPGLLTVSVGDPVSTWGAPMVALALLGLMAGLGSGACVQGCLSACGSHLSLPSFFPPSWFCPLPFPEALPLLLSPSPVSLLPFLSLVLSEQVRLRSVSPLEQLWRQPHRTLEASVFCPHTHVCPHIGGAGLALGRNHTLWVPTALGGGHGRYRATSHPLPGPLLPPPGL